MFTIYLNGEHFGYVATAEAVERVRSKYAARGFDVQSWLVSPDSI